MQYAARKYMIFLPNLDIYNIFISTFILHQLFKTLRQSLEMI